MSVPLILLAGGGTGGHLFPLMAVAEAIRETGAADVVYAGTSRGLEARVLPERGERLELIDVVPIKGGGLVGAARGVAKAASSVPHALSLIDRLAPSAVLSIGGYAAGTVALAARIRGVPLALLEPNSVLGLANRWLVPFARRTYVAFEEVKRRCPKGTGLLAGVPLRRGFARAKLVTDPAVFRVLVIGGSQGAAALNERLPEAVRLAARDIPGLQVVHQTGRDRDEAVRKLYGERGLSAIARVVPFIDDVASAIANADVVVARAGAGSIAEICAVGRGALLVPYPYAADDHQRKNAEALERAGAARCVVEREASPGRFARELVDLARHAERREAMASEAAKLGRPDAAMTVAVDLLRIAGIEGATANSTANSTSTSNGTSTSTSNGTSTSTASTSTTSTLTPTLTRERERGLEDGTLSEALHV